MANLGGSVFLLLLFFFFRSLAKRDTKKLAVSELKTVTLVAQPKTATDACGAEES